MNTVSTDRRKYELKARAERQRQTRERIVAATVALHEEVGPARTTITDIARRAGVQRLTVYNSFPDLEELFRACQTKFLAEHPPPAASPSDPSTGIASRPTGRRLAATLEKRYAWYRANRAMEESVHRDRHVVPALDALMRETNDVALDRQADALVSPDWGDRDARFARALARVALDFRTWDLLAARGMSDAAMARLLARAIESVARRDQASGAR